MNFIIKHIADYQIKKLCTAPRKKQFIKLGDAKTIGIVFEATPSEAFEVVKKFIQQVKAMGKNMHAIGFVNEKITPRFSYIKTDIDLFNKKELEFFYRPKISYIRTFCEEEKDILVDINLSDKTPLRYVVAASKAKCKVGIHLPQNEMVHDVLITTTPEQGIDFYLQQVIKYLKVV